MKIAFFDFDGTLIRHDSFIKFAIFSVGKKKLLKAISETLPYLIKWKLGLIDSSIAKEKLFLSLYKGMPYGRFKELGEEFSRVIDKDLRQEVIVIKDRHIREGHKVVIVTAGIGSWIRPWAEKNGIDRVIATEVEVDAAGNLSGRFSTPNCKGEEKALAIRHFIPDIKQYETWAYGNSSDDAEMLALATHPCKV